MTNDRKKRLRAPAAVGAALALACAAVTMVAFPSAVSAQTASPPRAPKRRASTAWAASASAIVDDASYTYIVLIDEELVAEDITDTDGSFVEFGPYEDGVYNVVVGWNQNEEYILDTDVTVACAAEVTTTVAPTTTIAVADATATAPAFTG